MVLDSFVTAYILKDGLESRREALFNRCVRRLAGAKILDVTDVEGAEMTADYAVKGDICADTCIVFRRPCGRLGELLVQAADLEELMGRAGLSV